MFRSFRSEALACGQTPRTDVYARNELADLLDGGAYRIVQLVRTEPHEAITVKIVDLHHGRKYQAMPTTNSLADTISAERRAIGLVGVHPNIVDIQEIYVGGGFAYFVLQPGTRSLIKAWSEEHHLNEFIYARYFKEMAQALDYIHSVGVVHRDVKHDNFMLGGSEGLTVKLCDFGSSDVLIGGRGLSDQPGTPPYMAPEMISIWAKHGPPVDVWALGVIVYTAFFGCWPYQPTDDTDKAMRMAILHGKILPGFASAGSLPQNVVSEDGIRFVKALLDRNQITRPSAACCLEMEYLKNWRYKQLKANTQGARSISLAPMLSAAMVCGVAKLKLLQPPPQVMFRSFPWNRMSTSRSKASISNPLETTSMSTRSESFGF